MPIDPMDAPRWARRVLPELPTGPHPFILEPGPPPVRHAADEPELGVTLLPDIDPHDDDTGTPRRVP